MVWDWETSVWLKCPIFIQNAFVSRRHKVSQPYLPNEIFSCHYHDPPNLQIVLSISLQTASEACKGIYRGRELMTDLIEVNLSAWESLVFHPWSSELILSSKDSVKTHHRVMVENLIADIMKLIKITIAFLIFAASLSHISSQKPEINIVAH